MVPVWFGGDYNPEQWSRDVWDDDVRLMGIAGVSMATVGVFSWARLEPREGQFDFEWLDDVLGRLHAGGVRVDLATATASPPPWLTHRYPEVLPVTESGVRLSAGSRQQYCPSSPVYRRFASRLVSKISERYASHPALELWHINNEYGCHNTPCFCDVSADAFRVWLTDKYGTIEALNDAWGTAFWSQAYGEFAEIYPPRAAPSFKNPTQLLDYQRFSSGESLKLYQMEAEIVRSFSPEVPITTNFMGFWKAMDYWAWAQEVDIVSHDSYPDPADPRAAMISAMERDLMRSLRHGQPWYLMEQSIGGLNWRTENAAKLPGQHRVWSHQAIARGADAVLYFQWRQSVRGSEKFASALVPHSGTDTRSWKDAVQVGAEVGSLADIVGTRLNSSVAIVLDWDSWWSIEQPALPTRIDYIDQLTAWYSPFFDRSLTVDFVRPTDDLSQYSLVVAPCLFVAADDAQDNLDRYVQDGGTLLVTFQSAITTPDAHLMPGGYLGRLRDTLGVWVEEFAPLARAEELDLPRPTIVLGGEIRGLDSGFLWSEYVRLSGAAVTSSFQSGPLTGWPAVTRNDRGSGAAWYCATLPFQPGIDALIGRLIADAGIVSPWTQLPPEFEGVVRGPYTFLFNHGTSAGAVPLPQGTSIFVGDMSEGELRLPPQGVAITRTD